MRRPRYDLGLAGIGIELGASAIAGTLLGLWIDRHWQTDPWGVAICASIGIVGGMVNFIRSARKAARDAQREATGDDSGATRREGAE